MSRLVIVAEGVWCAHCEVFEVPDWDGNTCMACGCHKGHHGTANVIIDEEEKV